MQRLSKGAWEGVSFFLAFYLTLMFYLFMQWDPPAYDDNIWVVLWVKMVSAIIFTAFVSVWLCRLTRPALDRYAGLGCLALGELAATFAELAVLKSGSFAVWGFLWTAGQGFLGGGILWIAWAGWQDYRAARRGSGITYRPIQTE